MSKKKLKKQFRSFELAATGEAEYVVEGYAAVFNQVVPLVEQDGITYFEVILPGAFDGANISNVIMYYGHGGKPVALTGNDTLRLEVDEHGLKFWAYLGGTEEGRNLWEEVKGGYITKMSFCFDMADECNFFNEEFTRKINKITDVYDVSAVDCPAYDGTEVHARKADDSVKNKIREKINKNKKSKRSNEKMTLEQINARLAEIEARRNAIAAMLEADEPAFTDVEGNTVTEEDILAEIDALDEEEEQLKTEKAALEDGAGPEEGADPDGENMRNVLTRRGLKRSAAGGTAQKRASASFIRNKATTIKGEELRSVLVSSGDIATPTGVGSKINDPHRSVSSIIDEVNVEDFTGLGAVKVPYVKDWQEADAHSEGNDAHESDPDFAEAEVSATDVAVTSYISRSYAKKTPLAYETKVKDGAIAALKKVAVRYIARGSADGKMQGVYNAKNTKGEKICKELYMKDDIGSGTLRDIVLSHGGDEEIAANCRLYLTKADLAAFGDVRDLEDKKVYDFETENGNPNRGVIKDGGLAVPYTIISHANTYSTTTATSEGVPTMFYGDPICYTLGLFGDFEVRADESVKAAARLIAILGDATIGGNVTVHHGFTVVVKKA